MEAITIDPSTGPHQVWTNDRIAGWLEDHLDQFGDRKEDILKAIGHVLDPARGGFIILLAEEGKILGAVLVNLTGMAGYIPENILVYIAVDRAQRGRGIGRKLMEAAIERAEGSIALHVEPDNPAKKLYESLGFTNKYLEMRLMR